MKALRIIYKVVYYIVLGVLCILLAFNLISAGARLILKQTNPTVLGFTTYVIKSGSMEDAISIDDFIVVKSKKEYKEGDVVTYTPRSGGTPTTHRIIEITDEGYITKGDANNGIDTDAPISKDMIIGKVIIVIPAFGKVLEFVQKPIGILTVVAIGAAIYFGNYYLEELKKKRTAENSADKEEQ